MLVRGRGRRMAAVWDCEREFMSEIRSGARLSQVQQLQEHDEANCNRNPETRQKLCGAHRWYRAAVV